MNDLESIREQLLAIDNDMAKLFEKRMKLSRKVAEYKKANSLPVLDESRERKVIDNALKNIEDENLKRYCSEFFQDIMDISKNYQHSYIEEACSALSQK
ncbi:MAG: chorismate mutase [Paludibacteraceae bacterium]|nr:chorismate mutase [Paludibacteraceae bacterium]